MHIVIRDHILEGDNLDELAACLLRWMPPLVPWMLDLQNEVKEQADEYGSEGKALLAIVKANPDKYKIDYHPSLESLKMLHSRMISLCDECGIILTNVVEEHYQLVYYMKASGNYAAITFFFNGKGFINYAAPLSDIGEADIKLSQLIEKLT